MDQIRKGYREDEAEIDLLELLQAWKKRFWLILLAGIIGGGGAGAFSKFILTPQYTSTAMLYVLSKETTLTSLADLQIGSQLTKDYQVIITSRPVLEEVIMRVGLDIDYKKLRKKLKIDNPSDTRIISISIDDPDPVMAKAIVDQLADSSSDYIGELMEMVPPKLIEDGEAAKRPTKPLSKRNAVFGAVFMAALVCGIIAVEVILNDTVRAEEDVEKYLGLSILASVPGREKDAKEDKKIKEKEVAGMAEEKKEKNIKILKKKGKGGAADGKSGTGTEKGNA